MKLGGKLQVSQQLRTKKYSATELCTSSLKEVAAAKTLNAFVRITEDLAKTSAAVSDKYLGEGNARSDLEGIPIAVKDNFCTANVTTTCASNMLADFIPPYNATVVEKLHRAGAVLIGKTNLDEFAMGCGTVESIFGTTLNPHAPVKDSEGIKWRTCGGSSGGSAVAVAANTCLAAIGSDTGGSVRNPASYCGIIGYKPTYGLVSRYGLIPLVNSMDVPGILSKDVDGVVSVLNVIGGHDPKDSTTVKDEFQPVDVSVSIHPRKIHVGVPREFDIPQLSGEVREVWKSVMDIFKKNDIKVSQVSMPHTAFSLPTYSVLNCCEVASNMSRYSGLFFGLRSEEEFSAEQLFAENRKHGFGKIVRQRILAGNFFLLRRNYMKYFAQALKVRRLIVEDFKNVWRSGVNILLTPTTLTTASLLDDFLSQDNSLQDFCTQPSNMSGCPAISIPITLSKDSLPISMQLLAPNFSDEHLLRVSKWLESKVQFPFI
nr:PREDICTED: glutamyl-tRNA(Gln) amidotransferase subunit A, mitochondrial isoform X2 [Bemisia tabaci]